jgi:hypothetical protein
MRQIGGIPAIVRLHSLPFAHQEERFGQMLLFVDLHLARQGSDMRYYSFLNQHFNFSLISFSNFL